MKKERDWIVEQLREIVTKADNGPQLRQGWQGLAQEMRQYISELSRAIDSGHLYVAKCRICGHLAFGERALGWHLPDGQHRCDDCVEWLKQTQQRAKERMTGSEHEG
jgi:hypothetical protein